jgi:predicted phosphoribosyltransferase
MGAIASGGVRVLNEDILRSLGIGEVEIETVERREAEELARRERAYRGERPAPELRGKRVILVDDGIATGATMRAAVQAVRKLGAARVTVAVPVGAQETLAVLRHEGHRSLVPRFFADLG